MDYRKTLSALIALWALLAVSACNETVVRQGPGSDGDVDADTDADADVDTDADTDADTDSDADADTDADTDADADSDTDADADSDTDADADSDTDADADSDTDADADSDTDADADSDTDADADSDTDTDTDEDTEPPMECPTSEDLAEHGAWIGCDPDSSDDDPYGIQGGWYMYGDPGGSCANAEPECDETGCRFHGRTVSTKDYENDWGCGMGLGLNTYPGEAEDGSEDIKEAYAGDATCFDIVIEGSSGGAEVRIGITQFETNDGKVSPFMPLGDLDDGWSGQVCFDIVECPAWEDIDCEVTGNNYDLQFQVAGGAVDGTFDLKVTSLVPNSDPGVVDPGGNCPAMQVNGSSCNQYPEVSVRADGKEYYVVGNAWGPGSHDGSQCIEWMGTNFKITSQEASSPNTPEPVSYPAVILGKKGNLSTSNSGLPVQVSAISSITTGFHTNATSVSGTFNAAYDIWTSSSPGGSFAEYFVMLWLENKGNKQPAGAPTGNVNIENRQWQVWTGGQGEGGGAYIAYVLQGGADSIDVDLKPFFDDAVANRGLPASQYVVNIQAGFEIWSGGGGLECKCFWADVN